MRRFKMLVYLVVLPVALLFSGCVGMSLPTGKGYSELCQTYVGRDGGELIDSWGQPGRTFDGQENKKVFVYVETKDEFSLNPLAHSALIEYPPLIDPRKSRPGEKTGKVTGQSVSSMDYCITYFEVGQDNKIVRALWKGDCKSLEKEGR